VLVAKQVFSLSVQFVRVQVKFFQIVDITVSPCPILYIPMEDGLNEGGAGMLRSGPTIISGNHVAVKG